MKCVGLGLVGYLTESIPALAENDNSYSTWEHENSMEMAWVIKSMEFCSIVRIEISIER